MIDKITSSSIGTIEIISMGFAYLPQLFRPAWFLLVCSCIMSDFNHRGFDYFIVSVWPIPFLALFLIILTIISWPAGVFMKISIAQKRCLWSNLKQKKELRKSRRGEGIRLKVRKSDFFYTARQLPSHEIKELNIRTLDPIFNVILLNPRFALTSILTDIGYEPIESFATLKGLPGEVREIEPMGDYVIEAGDFIPQNTVCLTLDKPIEIPPQKSCFFSLRIHHFKESVLANNAIFRLVAKMNDGKLVYSKNIYLELI